jgi:tetratricopeptide (TPR) repeat protein/2-polyprenyl-3-methyl-5-hydroxy-6-metoxy-1,4-benzoquinol methylase
MAAKKRTASDFQSAQAATLFESAVRAHQAGQLREAEQLYRRLLAADPKHVDGLHLLGVLAHQAGHSGVAVELIGQALALNDRVPEFHYNIGLAYGALGRFDQAAAHNSRAVALRPDYAEAHLNLGNALNAQKQHPAALESYRRALALWPSPEAHTNLANALAELGRTDEAIRHYRQALDLRPDHADAHNNLGVALMAQGDAAQAAEHHRRAAELNPAMTPALINLGNALRALGRPEEAIAWYQRALQRDPNHAEAHNNLGGALMARGAYADATVCFERALALKPDLAQALVNLGKTLVVKGDLARALHVARQTHDRQETTETRALFYLCLRDPRSAPHAAAHYDYLVRAINEPWGNPRSLTEVATSLIKQNAEIGACIARAESAWPRLPSADELYGASGFAALARDRLLHALLEAVQNSDVGLERLLTGVRALLLRAAIDGADDPDDGHLIFYCALARQCFINEYVFACSAGESDQVSELRQRVSTALASGGPVAPLALAALAAYVPLHTLPEADRLLSRLWPDAVHAVVAQQVSEPQEEVRHRAAMPRLTDIKDAGSLAVRQQYEENPYPRWTRTAPGGKPQPIDAYLRDRFPLAPFRPLGKPCVEYLVAGCGTGHQVASVALVFSDTKMTAIDLSLASLGYAKRMAGTLGLCDVVFGQADILELASLGRTFDVVDSSGVLHHVSDGYAGWRVLLSILRPGGIMRTALYSTIARRDIAVARECMASRGLKGTVADIRLARQAIMSMPDARSERNVMKIKDFFSTSDCRDLLFHVQERTSTIPELKAFLAQQDLTFLGFESDPGTLQRYAERFPDDPAKTNLDYWHAFEQDNPDTFLAMYEFWTQKRG